MMNPIGGLHILFGFMTRAVHSTILAVTAVTNYGFALALLSDHTDDDRGYNACQYGADNDCPNVAYNPCNH